MASSNTRSELTAQMFEAVGRAITEWSFVEERLCHILAVCTDNAAMRKSGFLQYSNLQAPMLMFYAVENFRSRLLLVNAAVEAYFTPGRRETDELKAEWDKLNMKTGKLARKRNRLAHWTVLPAQPTGSGEDHEPMAPPRLLPPIGSPGWYAETGFFRTGKSLTLVQVRHLQRAFYLLAEKLSDFTCRMARSEVLRVRSSRRLVDQLLLAHQSNHDLAAQLERVRSSLK